MAKKSLCVWCAAVALTALTGQPSAQTTLLGSIADSGTGVSLCHSDSVAIYFSLSWGVMDFPEHQVSLGYPDGIHWHDGDAGHYDYTESNTDGFDVLVGGITNGVDDRISLDEWIVDGGGAGTGRWESSWGLGSPDLAGCDVSLVRLVVVEVDLPRDGDYIGYSYSIRWEFWGPGPSVTDGSTWGRIKAEFEEKGE